MAPSLAWCMALLLVISSSPQWALGYTTPDTLQRLITFRDLMRGRSKNWDQAMSTWTCPTPASKSTGGSCDPCGVDTEGNWFHLHCRGNSQGWGESGDGAQTGLLTNVHITDVQIDGPVPRELCLFPTLRELDLDGGHLDGPIPEWLPECFPALEELDLSYNKLSGTLPKVLATMPLLSEVKVEVNDLIGTIPPEIPLMPRLRRFQTEQNAMEGPIPAEFSTRNKTLTEFLIADNDYSGNLHMLGGTHLLVVSVHNNPQLCGMVPGSVRWAHGYNPAGTRLGQPC